MSRPSAYRAINHTGPWTFGGHAIAADNAALWASPAAADPADTAAPQVQTTLANVDDDLVITIDVPAGHIHAVTVTDAGLQITVADIGPDCCRMCGEHFSNPHTPGCMVGAADEAALAAQDDTAMLAALRANPERRPR
ncbi:hypothetical protein A8M60_01735 [Nocardia farcinica]|nr:hypothetical protein A8M60_01735 [Nocardia farcinica]